LFVVPTSLRVPCVSCQCPPSLGLNHPPMLLFLLFSGNSSFTALPRLALPPNKKFSGLLRFYFFSFFRPEKLFFFPATHRDKFCGLGLLPFPGGSFYFCRPLHLCNNLSFPATFFFFLFWSRDPSSGRSPPSQFLIVLGFTHSECAGMQTPFGL